MVDAVATIEHLTKEFRVGGRRRLVAVNDVSFEILLGEALGLIGESGSGKSTVARCIVGLLKPESGRLVWANEKRPRVSMVFQDPRGSMNPKFRLWESIADPLIARGSREENAVVKAVAQASRQVELGARDVLALPSAVSDEVIQRASIARALVTDPDLLVLDEPTSSLDPEGRAAVLGLIERIRMERRMTALLITHDLSAVRKVTNRVCIMYLGMLMEVGPTAEIFARPTHPYTRALLSSNLELDPTRPPEALQLIGEIPDPTARPPGCPLAPRCPWAVAQCSAEVPALRGVQGRLVACIRAEEFIAGANVDGVATAQPVRGKGAGG